MSNSQRITLAVSGMTCNSCVRHVTDALQGLEGVGAVEVRVKEGKVHVQHDPASAPLTAMVEALRDAGYESTPAV
ncbi:MAG TPA: heavy metal-associated domain-containing protein [Archangium sp.]|uniref:heavy-metal-associated domain-containing protein n=1 Tax=Archangium sp. TaxID=1872627 RepID=UPI002E31670B|nr:heavy metal-associated domain-containing protein [Archangium sp.]HEX5751022.1 heavy metal-associated domain-containing protein [Archangium sp.]